MPSKATICELVEINATGLVLDKKETQEKDVLTEEALDDICARLEAKPKILLPLSAS
jgi:hypothetical protein